MLHQLIYFHGTPSSSLHLMVFHWLPLEKLDQVCKVFPNNVPFFVNNCQTIRKLEVDKLYMVRFSEILSRTKSKYDHYCQVCKHLRLNDVGYNKCIETSPDLF